MIEILLQELSALISPRASNETVISGVVDAPYHLHGSDEQSSHHKEAIWNYLHQSCIWTLHHDPLQRKNSAKVYTKVLLVDQAFPTSGGQGTQMLVSMIAADDVENRC
jgi:hypothetical protein